MTEHFCDTIDAADFAKKFTYFRSFAPTPYKRFECHMVIVRNKHIAFALQPLNNVLYRWGGRQPVDFQVIVGFSSSQW